jgi:outer membrane protein
MNRKFFCLLFLIAASFLARAQDKWDLRTCVDYALTNNISVKQQDVQARLTALTYKQSKLSQYPSLSLNGNVAYSAGRNQDPVNFNLITESYLSSGYTLQSGVEIFNWFSKRNDIAGNQLETEAAFAGVEKLKNDIALNVAGVYLQALLARQQVGVSAIQIQQTKAQLDNTRKLVQAGSLPELNAIQLEAQLANDSSNLVTAQGNEAQSLLLLKAYLNLDASTPFDIETPDVNAIPLDDLASLQPAAVYELALKNLPQQRVNDLRIKAAEKFVASARGQKYPTFSAFGSLSSRYNSRVQTITGVTQSTPPIANVTVGGTKYDVFPLNPINNYSYSKQTYFNQLNQNFGQSVGISLSIPIANGGQLKTGYVRSQLNLKGLQLQRDLDNQTLKNDIYKAYTDVITSLQKFNAATKTVEANQKAFDFATKRYNVGLLNTIDLITTQNNLFSAKLQQLVAQFDYVFKMKVLEFYKGQGLKL